MIAIIRRLWEPPGSLRPSWKMGNAKSSILLAFVWVFLSPGSKYCL